jgi:hypothetical protein
MGRAAASILVLLVAAIAPGRADAAGAAYSVEGGTSSDRAQVASALAASSFDWSVLAHRVSVHLVRGVDSYAQPGHIWLNTDLLKAGSFSWAIVQDEFAHQVDFLLFDDATRRTLRAALGARAWCYTDSPGLRHRDYGCERFASTLVWAFWPSSRNSYRPRSASDESAAMSPAPFRALVSSLVASRLAALGLAR